MSELKDLKFDFYYEFISIIDNNLYTIGDSSQINEIRSTNFICHNVCFNLTVTLTETQQGIKVIDSDNHAIIGLIIESDHCY